MMKKEMKKVNYTNKLKIDYDKIKVWTEDKCINIYNDNHSQVYKRIVNELCLEDKLDDEGSYYINIDNEIIKKIYSIINDENNKELNKIDLKNNNNIINKNMMSVDDEIKIMENKIMMLKEKKKFNESIRRIDVMNRVREFIKMEFKKWRTKLSEVNNDIKTKKKWRENNKKINWFYWSEYKIKNKWLINTEIISKGKTKNKMIKEIEEKYSNQLGNRGKHFKFWDYKKNDERRIYLNQMYKENKFNIMRCLCAKKIEGYDYIKTAELKFNEEKSEYCD